jgi:hypothetical protein
MVRVRWAIHAWRAGMVQVEESASCTGLFFGPVFCDAISEAAAKALLLAEKPSKKLDGVSVQVSFNCPIAVSEIAEALREQMRNGSEWARVVEGK